MGRVSFPLNNKAVRKERAGFSLSLYLVLEICWQKAYPGGSSIGRQSKNYELGEVKDFIKRAFALFVKRSEALVDERTLTNSMFSAE